MLIYHYTAVELSAFEIREELGGHLQDARTTGADLAAYLHKRGVRANAIEPGTAQVRSLLHSEVYGGHPGAILGAYVAPGFLHWILYRAAGNGLVGYNDPWTDSFQIRHWGWLLARYAGQVVTTAGASAQ